MSNIKNLLNKLGFNHLNLNINNIDLYLNRIEQRMNDQYKQNMNSSIEASSKLSFFHKIFIPTKRPTYLDLCKTKNERSILCKLRLSSHNLAIERGRYNNTEKSERICLSCDNKNIEDEFHFLSTCPHYNNPRNNLIEKLKNLLGHPFPHTLTMKEIKFLLNNNSYPIIKTFIKFLQECWQMRKHN